MGTSIPERQLFIGGKWVQPAKKERFDVVCPHDESVIGSIPLATMEDVDAGVAAALAAKGAWGKTTGAFRASFLRKMASKASCAAPNAESCPALPRRADDAWCMMMRSPGNIHYGGAGGQMHATLLTFGHPVPHKGRQRHMNTVRLLSSRSRRSGSSWRGTRRWTMASPSPSRCGTS